MDCQICFISRLYDEIEVFCAGEIIDSLQENDHNEIIEFLRNAVQHLSPADSEILLEQGIAMTFDNPQLASEIEKALAIKTYRVELEKNTPDDEYYEWYDWDDNSDELIGEEQKSDIEFDFMRGLTEDEMIKNVIANQSPCVEFDETGKYYRYKDNSNRENQRTFDTIAEAYDFLCQDADGACIFFCDGYGETQGPPTLDWLKKVIKSCGKVEVEIRFPDGKKDIWIYQKER